MVARLPRVGWEFHPDIVRHKCAAGVKRAGLVIQKPYRSYYDPNIMTEYILIVRKPAPAIDKERNADAKQAAHIPINCLFTLDIANNLWHI